jgi:hypothetical protein
MFDTISVHAEESHNVFDITQRCVLRLRNCFGGNLDLASMISAGLKWDRFLLLSTGSLGSELGIYKIDSFELHGPCNNSGLVQVEVPQGANEWF